MSNKTDVVIKYYVVHEMYHCKHNEKHCMLFVSDIGRRWMFFCTNVRIQHKPQKRAPLSSNINENEE